MATERSLERLSKRLGRQLATRGWTIATAESCTGGWIAKTLTDIGGSSQWFKQGWVSYSNESKQSLLGVSRALLERDGAVSESVVRAMARGALIRSGANLAIAVSGIAGPGGAMPGKPVGTVWLAWGVRDGKRIKLMAQRKHFKGNRAKVRRSAVRVSLLGALER